MHFHLKGEDSKMDEGQKLNWKLREIISNKSVQYYGSVQNYIEEGVCQRDIKVALYLWGSKVTHSCQPNLYCSSKTKDGKMEVTAICPIQEGDVLTISYLSELYESTIYERRVQLLRDKKFLCQCRRCIDIDYCRPLSCTVCSATMYCQDDRKPCIDEKSQVWVCSGCGPRVPEQMITILSEESTFGECMQKFKRQLLLVDPEVIDEYIDVITAEYSPLHALALKAVRYKAHVLVSLCHESGSKQLRLESAVTLLDLVNRMECCAAKCNGIDCQVDLAYRMGLVPPHPPVFQATQDVFYASQDLLLYDASEKSWPRALVATMRKYLQFLFIMFGADDEDILKLASKLPRDRNDIQFMGMKG